jgi:hypothetical protein
MKEYYEASGWEPETGKPLASTLQRLKLDFVNRREPCKNSSVDFTSDDWLSALFFENQETVTAIHVGRNFLDE